MIKVLPPQEPKSPTLGRFLVVGDPHAEQSELEECDRLVDFCIEKAKETKATAILFLGDLHHNHSIVHLDVLMFWKKSFEKIIANGLVPVSIVGNHDMAANKSSTANAMVAYSSLVIPSNGCSVFGDCALVSYCHTEEEFSRAIESIPPSVKYLFCHQTFQGSVYENGFYAKDGFSLDIVRRFSEVISGHIHTPQNIGNVTYVGAPRWRTASDANVKRFVYLKEFKNGALIHENQFPTSEVCKELVAFQDSEDAPTDPTPEMALQKVMVDISGSKDRVTERTLLWKSKVPGCRVRVFLKTVKTTAVRESMGVERALLEYVKNFTVTGNTSSEEIQQYISKGLGI